MLPKRSGRALTRQVWRVPCGEGSCRRGAARVHVHQQACVRLLLGMVCKTMHNEHTIHAEDSQFVQTRVYVSPKLMSLISLLGMVSMVLAEA
jgi:hypothetical protein